MARTACTSLPLILHIIEAKLSPQANIKLHGLRNLVESVRPDTTDWFYGAIHGIIGLAQLEEPDPTSTITPNELTLSENSSPGGPVSELGSHPSIYLRLALSLDWGMSNNELPNADQLSSCLLRMFATSSMNRIRTILNGGLKAGRSPSEMFAETARSAGEEVDDQSGQSKDSDWSEQDQAILFGLQLGIISPDMAMEWAEDVVSPESLPTEDGAMPQTPCEAAISGHNQDTVEHAKWKEIAGQAFSDTVDIPERNVLDAFIFRDQLPGERLQDAATDAIKDNEDAGTYNVDHHNKLAATVPDARDMAMTATLLDGLESEQNMVGGDWAMP